MSRKIGILVYGRMPTEKAYGIHALNQSKSFEKLGYEVELIYPSTNNSKTIDKTIPEYYNENLNFKIIEKDNFDLTGLGIFKFLPDFLKKILWLLSSYMWAKKLRNELNDSIIWSTNPIICWTLKSSYKIIFEKHGEGKLLQKVFINKLKDKQFYLIGTTITSYNELKKINIISVPIMNVAYSDNIKSKLVKGKILSICDCSISVFFEELKNKLKFNNKYPFYNFGLDHNKIKYVGNEKEILEQMGVTKKNLIKYLF